MHYHLAHDWELAPKSSWLSFQKLLGLSCLAVFLVLVGRIWIPYVGAVVNASAITFLPPQWSQQYFAATLPKTMDLPSQNKLLINTSNLHIEAPIVEGDSPETLLKGVGHAPSSALPGEQGRVVISGHRFYPNPSPYATTFFALDKLKVGDSVTLTYSGHAYVYRVRDSWEVSKDKAAEQMKPTTARELTIYTCNPTYSSQRRLGFTAVMDESQVKDDSQKLIDTLHDGLFN